VPAPDDLEPAARPGPEREGANPAPGPRRVFSARVVVQLLIFLVLVPLLPLLISWRWSWWQAWVFAAVHVLGSIISRVLASRRHPDLIAERARLLQHEDAKSWDKAISAILVLGGASLPLVAGLDARFGWSPGFSLPLELTALAFILAGSVFSSWALVENRFFSGVVRIQTERGHSVVSTGPYRWVRHPGYAGGLVTYAALPLLLDSAWAFLPVLLLSSLLVVRTSLEDRTLRAELPGYAEYACRVRFRLLPGVW